MPIAADPRAQPSALVRYEDMRVAVEQCARIDEAADLRDKAAALQAYARQRDDRDLDVWMSEIKLRASVRIGELVRELDKAQPGPAAEIGDSTVAQPSKLDAVAAAGLTPRTAQRYQELAGPREEQAQKAAHAGAENYFAAARASRTPATMEGLRGAVKDAVVATVGPKPTRPPSAAPVVKPVGADWIDWVSAVQHVAAAPIDPADLALRSPVSNPNLLNEAKAALPKLQSWIDSLEQRQ